MDGLILGLVLGALLGIRLGYKSGLSKGLHLGWVKAHYDIANEIETLGDFRVDDKVFHCHLVVTRTPNLPPAPNATTDTKESS